MRDLKEAWLIVLTGIVGLLLLGWMMTYPPDWAEPMWPGSSNKDQIQKWLGLSDDFTVDNSKSFEPVEAEKPSSIQLNTARIENYIIRIEKATETIDRVSDSLEKSADTLELHP